MGLRVSFAPYPLVFRTFYVEIFRPIRLLKQNINYNPNNETWPPKTIILNRDNMSNTHTSMLNIC